jgi:hypothetical protein
LLPRVAVSRPALITTRAFSRCSSLPAMRGGCRANRSHRWNVTARCSGGGSGRIRSDAQLSPHSEGKCARSRVSANGVRLMLDDLARHGFAVRGQRGDEPDQLKRDARRALRRHRLRPLPGLSGSLGAGGGGVARHVVEPGMPEQVVPVGWVENPATTGMPSRSRSSATLVSISSPFQGSIRKSSVNRSSSFRLPSGW